jgi:hypothetical protein
MRVRIQHIIFIFHNFHFHIYKSTKRCIYMLFLHNKKREVKLSETQQCSQATWRFLLLRDFVSLLQHSGLFVYLQFQVQIVQALVFILTSHGDSAVKLGAERAINRVLQVEYLSRKIGVRFQSYNHYSTMSK